MWQRLDGTEVFLESFLSSLESLFALGRGDTPEFFAATVGEGRDPGFVGEPEFVPCLAWAVPGFIDYAVRIGAAQREVETDAHGIAEPAGAVGQVAIEYDHLAGTVIEGNRRAPFQEVFGIPLVALVRLEAAARGDRRGKARADLYDR